MKKSSKVLAIALALVLVFSIVGLVACNDDKENYPEPSGYEVDWSNNFGTVTFYNGDSLIGQGKLSEHLDMAQQETLVVEDETYVFYSFVQLLYNLSFAEFEKIDLIDSNDVETIFPFSYEQFISLIAIVGVVEDGEFVQFNKMAVGVKSQQTKKSDIYYNIVKVVCDPIEDVDYDELIAPENKTDLSALTIGDITVYNGSNALFTIQKSDLAALDQYVLTITTTTKGIKKFVAFRFADIVEAKNVTLPAFTNVKAANKLQQVTSLEHAYILIAKVDDPDGPNLNNIPRFVFDPTTVSDMNSDVAKNVSSIILNYEA